MVDAAICARHRLVAPVTRHDVAGPHSLHERAIRGTVAADTSPTQAGPSFIRAGNRWRRIYRIARACSRAHEWTALRIVSTSLRIRQACRACPLVSARMHLFRPLVIRSRTSCFLVTSTQIVLAHVASFLLWIAETKTAIFRPYFHWFRYYIAF